MERRGKETGAGVERPTRMGLNPRTDAWASSLLQMMVASMQVPTLDEITKKEQTIKEALNYKFNDKDIEDVGPCLRVDPFHWCLAAVTACIY